MVVSSAASTLGERLSALSWMGFTIGGGNPIGVAFISDVSVGEDGVAIAAFGNDRTGTAPFAHMDSDSDLTGNLCRGGGIIGKSLDSSSLWGGDIGLNLATEERE